VRTTIDLPDDLHAQAVAIARDTHQTLSQAVAGLIPVAKLHADVAALVPDRAG
jgi:hypothetical protein